MVATLQPTFTGFVATTIDAAYLVEAAAVARTLPRLASRTGDARALVRSGAVLVHGEEYRRWKDGRRWTDGRNLGNGFSLYRELATDDADRMSQEDLADENEIRGELYPFLDAHVGRKGSKKDGLIKKVIKLQIGGQEWGLVAYYTLDDAIKDRLARPRNTSLNAGLVAWGLNPDFFAQPRKAARTAVMTDDDGQSPVRSWESWFNAPMVLPGSYPQSAQAIQAWNAFLAAAAAVPAPPQQRRQQQQHRQQQQQQQQQLSTPAVSPALPATADVNPPTDNSGIKIGFNQPMIEAFFEPILEQEKQRKEGQIPTIVALPTPPPSPFPFEPELHPLPGAPAFFTATTVADDDDDNNNTVLFPALAAATPPTLSFAAEIAVALANRYTSGDEKVGNNITFTDPAAASTNPVLFAAQVAVSLANTYANDDDNMASLFDLGDITPGVNCGSQCEIVRHIDKFGREKGESHTGSKEQINKVEWAGGWAPLNSNGDIFQEFTQVWYS